MDQLLAQQLLDLGEDTQLRKRNLTNLISQLTHQEVRDLATLLSRADFRTDIVSRLPPELRINVAGHFGEVDVLCLLNVSKQWRAMWLQRDLLSIVSEQCRYLDWSLFDGVDFGHSPEQWTTRQYELIRLRRCRFLGRFSSAIVVRHDVGDGHAWLNTGLDLAGVFPVPSSGKSEAAPLFSRTEAPSIQHKPIGGSLYEDGRLVWVTDTLPSPDNILVVVEDLRSRTKRIYRNPSVIQYGPGFELKAIGDKLLVAGVARVMFIWHLESNEFLQISLPQQPKCCATNGEQVAFLRPDGLLIWTWGSQLNSVDFGGVVESNQRVAESWPTISPTNTMGIFFDPFEEGTLYLAVCFTDIRLVVVHRFTPEGYSGAREISMRVRDAKSRFAFDDSYQADGIEASTTACRALRPANSYGDFPVAEWRTIRSGASSSFGPAPTEIQTSGETFVEVRFNVRTGEHSLIEKAMPSGSAIIGSVYAAAFPLLPSWNDQMIFALRVTQNRRLFGGGGRLQLTPWELAAVVLPVHPASTGWANVRLWSLRSRGDLGPHAELLRVPHSMTVEEQLDENNLNLSPAKSTTLQTAEGRIYGMRPQSDSPEARTQALRSLYSESDFVLDLNATSSLVDDGHRIDGPCHIFQDDEFIILLHQRGYIAWDFRPSSASA
ncbi:hypothetical protein GE09DRAFT_37798 [Coniochaeta sp. 2T2.1]|nr:hypothetical protein GE09DRAFT_37798 [Coniochaeta sp. 2T2.1]